MELMTSKQIAEVLGITADSVNRIARELGLEARKQFVNGGVTACYDEEQVAAIKHKMDGNGNRSSTSHDEFVETNQIALKSDVLSSVSLLADMEFDDFEDEQIGQLWLLSQRLIGEKLKRIAQEKQNLEIELDKAKEWYTIKRMEILNPDRQFNWRQLKAEALRLSPSDELRKDVFDANYKQVKAYHVSVWESLFADSIEYE